MSYICLQERRSFPSMGRLGEVMDKERTLVMHGTGGLNVDSGE